MFQNLDVDQHTPFRLVNFNYDTKGWTAHITTPKSLRLDIHSKKTQQTSFLFMYLTRPFD